MSESEGSTAPSSGQSPTDIESEGILTVNSSEFRTAKTNLCTVFHTHAPIIALASYIKQAKKRKSCCCKEAIKEEKRSTIHYRGGI